jgi:hypothetical protein
VSATEAERPTRAQRVEALAAFERELGRKPLQREIAERLGVSRSYASALVNDPDGSADRERKKRYAGVCDRCGGPTCGSDGRAKAPKTCMSCLVANEGGARRVYRRREGPWPLWNRQKCEDTIVEWVRRNRRIPRAIDLLYADPEQPRPCFGTIARWCFEYEQRTQRWPRWGDDQWGTRRLIEEPEKGWWEREVTLVTRGFRDVLVDLAPRFPVEAIVAGVRNATTRAALFQAVGVEKLVLEHGECVSHDDYGMLWKLEREDWREPVVMVGVVNSTPEPDGSFKEYFLRVPPDVETAREAIAWTFGLTVDEYEPSVQT